SDTKAVVRLAAPLASGQSDPWVSCQCQVSVRVSASVNVRVAVSVSGRLSVSGSVSVPACGRPSGDMNLHLDVSPATVVAKISSRFARSVVDDDLEQVVARLAETCHGAG